MCALREHRAPPGSAGLGQSTVGGHVRSKTAHNLARQSSIMGGRLEKSFRLCVCAPLTINLRVGTGKCLVSLSEFVFIFALHSLHSVWSHYACCFHRLLGQELFSFFLLFIFFFFTNGCIHSCGTQACLHHFPLQIPSH